MADFYFQGDIPGSKSIFNRALIVKSFFPVLDLHGFSNCDDVRHMREGLKILRDRNRINCGEGGTTFRFMALRTSRQKGVHTLEATPRLMQRPKSGLLDLLRQLGVQAQVKGNELFVVSEGWKRPKTPIRVDTSESSQYASALVLSSWLLEFDLEFELEGRGVSESYFELTLEMVKEMGMRIKTTPRGYLIPAGQRISKLEWSVEPDLSSAFTMAAAGALAGDVTINNFPEKSSQPDLIFLEIFKKMQVNYSLGGHTLNIKKSPNLLAIEWNLFQAPDLFPVLAVLCSWAQGTSRLYGAPQLALKESNRIARVSELLRLLDIQHEPLEDGIVIHGNPSQKTKQGVKFNSDQDHRMVMAAALMKLKGHDIQIENPEAINKSFPEFWGMIGVNP